MAEHNLFGQKGEDAAAEYLEKKGYKIIDRNKRYGHLEIDIIAEHENMIVFAEVKSRRSSYFEEPYAAVTKNKQKKLIKAANIYIEKNEIKLEARFDIISITEKNGKFFIKHIKDAFYPSL